MERKFRRLASRSKRREATTLPEGNQSLRSSLATSNEYNDRQLAQNRYKEANSRLKELIKNGKGPWDSFDFEEEFSREPPEGFDDSQFITKINEILISREKSIKDRKGWAKFTYAVECIFTAFSPFAKNFLTVAANAQSVISISLVDFHSNCVDTRTKSIWFSLRRSLPLNNGIPICD